MKYDRVILDYGHGGMIDGKYQTAGKQYHFTEPEEFSFYEGVFNRGVASKLMGLLLENGIEVYDPVEGCYVTEDRTWEDLEQADVSLAVRVSRANSENKRGSTLFLSVHSNAIGKVNTGPSQNVRGASVFVYRNSGDVGLIASNLMSEYKTTCLRPRKIVENQSFYVLRKTSMPAMLTENGFYVNIDDAKCLSTEEGQWEVARAHFESMKNLLDIRSPNIV